MSWTSPYTDPRTLDSYMPKTHNGFQRYQPRTVMTTEDLQALKSLRGSTGVSGGWQRAMMRRPPEFRQDRPSKPIGRSNKKIHTIWQDFLVQGSTTLEDMHPDDMQQHLRASTSATARPRRPSHTPKPDLPPSPSRCYSGAPKASFPLRTQSSRGRHTSSSSSSVVSQLVADPGQLLLVTPMAGRATNNRLARSAPDTSALRRDRLSDLLDEGSAGPSSVQVRRSPQVPRLSDEANVKPGGDLQGRPSITGCGLRHALSDGIRLAKWPTTNVVSIDGHPANIQVGRFESRGIFPAWQRGRVYSARSAARRARPAAAAGDRQPEVPRGQEADGRRRLQAERSIEPGDILPEHSQSMKRFQYLQHLSQRAGVAI